MFGIIIGVIAAIGICVQAFEGTLDALSIGIAVVIVLIGFIFPQTVGIALTTISITSPIAIILALVSGSGSSALSALAIGITAFAGQYIIGLVRQDVSGLRLRGR
jgi:hypothetical protein